MYKFGVYSRPLQRTLKPVRTNLRTFTSTYYARAALDYPIGVEQPPKPTDNQGIDDRSLEQKKSDLFNYEKNLERRKEIEYEFTKGLSQVHAFRRSSGKFWDSPGSYFRADKALYMPNFWGTVLGSGEKSGTTSVLKGKISVVRAFSVLTGENQSASYFDQNPNTLVHKDFQIVDINLPDSFVKELIVKMFTWNIKKQVPDLDRQSRYFICRKGVTRSLRQSIMADNQYGGYIYLVDRNCKIRWAASGDATPQDKINLRKFIDAVAKEQ
jgi:ATPase complex subunit ATP10